MIDLSKVKKGQVLTYVDSMCAWPATVRKIAGGKIFCDSPGHTDPKFDRKTGVSMHGRGWGFLTIARNPEQKPERIDGLKQSVKVVVRWNPYRKNGEDVCGHYRVTQVGYYSYEDKLWRTTGVKDEPVSFDDSKLVAWYPMPDQD